MFNAIKGVAAGAIVAVGGYLLVGTGRPQQRSSWLEPSGPRVMSGPAW